MSNRVKICFISSHGGHLRELLDATREVNGNTYYVTFKTSHTVEALAGKHVYFIIDPHKSVLKYMVNLLQSFLHVLVERPGVVISTGAGIAIPTMLLCKYLLGSRIIFIESAANVVNPSKTGLFIYRYVDLFLIQWPTLQDKYPNARCVGLIL